MKINDIKKLDLREWLISNGYRHIKGTLFVNPLRTDKNPSFSVFQNDKNRGWCWSDKASGESGNIIDLVQKMENCTVAEVVKIFNQDSFSFSKASKNVLQKIDNNYKKSNIDIINIQNLQNVYLLEYLKTRKISKKLALKYLKEMKYRVNNKEYFSLCFKNDSNGYELRNKYSKMNIKGKSITTIKGKNSKKVSIFEGFMDFLSALEYFKIDKFKGDVIVLNSTVLLDDLLANNHFNSYNNIYTFLDNDYSGYQALSKIIKKINNKTLINCSNIYKDYNDFNEFWIRS